MTHSSDPQPKPPAPRRASWGDRDDLRRDRVESVVFLALVLITTAIFVWMVRAFLTPIFWAAVFAVLFYGPHRKVLASCGDRRNLAALVSTLAVVMLVVVPFTFVVVAIADQALGLYEGISTGRLSVHAPVDVVERWTPRLSQLLARVGISVDQIRDFMQQAGARVTQFIATRAFAIGQNALWIAVHFALMAYLLFFFFRDGRRIVAAAARVIPLEEGRRRRLVLKFAQVTRATLKGGLIIALAQGGLGALLFWIAGIQTAILWGVMMAVLSLLPAVGAGLVWLPAGIILLVTGQTWQGIFVLLGGAIVISMVDNLLRPIVVGRDTKLPDYVILLSTLGGIAVFGLAGFVAGPVIAASCLVLWELFDEEYGVPDPLISPETPVSVAAVGSRDDP